MSEATVQDLLIKIDQLESKLKLLNSLLPLVSSTCGRHNCNCPGSHKIKQLIDSSAMSVAVKGSR